MRIAIIGAGIGGLVAAAGLRRDGHEVTVYEQLREPGAIGAGLTLFGNAFAALDAIGLGDPVREISIEAMAGVQAGQRLPSGRWLVRVPASTIASMRSVHRVALHQKLLDEFGRDRVKAGCRVDLASQTGEPTITVDGRQERVDLVVAADGLRSRTRSRLGLDPGLRYAGYTAWRGVTATETDIGGQAGETWGRGQRFGIVPLPGGRVYWFATLTTPENTVFADEHGAVRDHFAGWHPPIHTCLDATSPDEVLRHDIHSLAEPLTSFGKGRVVLVGDAAHAMTPDLGQGAGQAIEDAATLVLLLRQFAHSPVDEAALGAVLARYDNVRRPRTATMLRRSTVVGRVGQLQHPVGAGLRDAILLALPSRLLGNATHGLQSWPSP